MADDNKVKAEDAESVASDESPAIEDTSSEEEEERQVYTSIDQVPAVFRSGDEARPLRYVDVKGNVYTYVFRPMWYAAIFVLGLEMAERFTYYALSPEYQAYLQLPMFADFSVAESAATAQIMRGLGYTWPLISAIFADAYFGIFNTLLVTALIYMAALILITIAGSADAFADWMVPMYFYVLFPAGFGGIKSLVNIMGANQFHPVIHKGEISGYYLIFYICVNIGAIASTVIQVYANELKDQYELDPDGASGPALYKAFVVPAAVFAVGIVVFLAGRSRYVYRKPIGSAILEIFKVLGSTSSSCPPRLEDQKVENGGKFESTFVEDTRQFLALVPLLFVANFFFAMAYWQQDTLVIQQGFEMSSTWGVQSNELNSFINPVCVVLFAGLLESVIFPWLRKRNMEPSHMNKFILGCFCGILAMLWGSLTDHLLKSDWNTDNEQNISVFWSIPVYALVALGEVFANPAALDMAYKISPDSLKAVAAGVHGIMSGAVPNFVSAAIAAGLSTYLQDGNGCSTRNPNANFFIGTEELECETDLEDPNKFFKFANDTNSNIPADIWDYRTVRIKELYIILAIFPAVGIIFIHFSKPFYEDLLRRKDEQMRANTKRLGNAEASAKDALDI